MRLQSLKHLIEVIQAVARPDKIHILGSSSLLATHPELGEANQPLELTDDADFLLRPVNEAIAESLQVAAGHDSAFMSQYGYCADILRPEISAALPAGWESRSHPVADYNNVFALDAYDLALVKLQVGRKKDLDLLRALLRMKIIEGDRLRRHYHNCALDEPQALAAGKNLQLLFDESSLK